VEDEMAKHIRHGVGALRPYIYGDASTRALILAIGGEVVEDLVGPKGSHLEARVGDSMIVVEERADWPATQARSSMYAYVPDVDAAYAAALKAGAQTINAPEDKPYQERAGGVRDGFGNTWYLATYTG
jgi:PhnB protein